MATTSGFSDELSSEDRMARNEFNNNNDGIDDDDDNDGDDDDDDDDEDEDDDDYAKKNDDDDDDLNGDEMWGEMDVQSESSINCLFCNHSFKTMAVALEHCRIEHNFKLSDLKNRFNMDCYSYICMINYIRHEGITSEVLLSLNEPPWLNDKYLAPVIQDDPWLMFDFDGFESPVDSQNVSPIENYHIVNAENGLVTLTEHHFTQLQHKIRHLTMQVQAREEALILATDQINKMKVIMQNLVCSDCTGSQETGKVVAKIKSSDDDNGYFSSYSHFGIHHEMLSDRIRTSKYRNAILNNSNLFANKIVLDVGCGTGILSMFAASAGAYKVYGIDKSEIIFSAMDIVRENNFSDKIHLIHAKIEDVLLPVEKVDIIISEWMGYFLLYEGMLDSIIAARNKYLKSDGLLLPNKCILYIMGISDSVAHQSMLGFWSDVYGFKMSCLLENVIQEAQVIEIKKESIATTSSIILDLDLHKISDCTHFESDFCLESYRDGNLTAFCSYFDAVFELPNFEVLSTNPKSGKTHWKQTVFFLKNPMQISKGCTIKGKLSCKRSKEDNRALAITIFLYGLDQKLEYFLN